MAQRPTSTNAQAKADQPTGPLEHLLVFDGEGGRTVAFQWIDGAGELQYWALSPDQSIDFLATHAQATEA